MARRQQNMCLCHVQNGMQNIVVTFLNLWTSHMWSGISQICWNCLPYWGSCPLPVCTAQWLVIMTATTMARRAWQWITLHADTQPTYLTFCVETCAVVKSVCSYADALFVSQYRMFIANVALQRLYNEAKDHKFAMEALNRYGGKFIKEVTVNSHLLLYTLARCYGCSLC